MTPDEKMRRLDDLLSHVWMVRAFLKHCDEAETDEDLAEVHRVLYDFMLSLGGFINAGDAEGYLRQAKKKLAKLKSAAEAFVAMQPAVSTHTNFVMAARSLRLAAGAIAALLADAPPLTEAAPRFVDPSDETRAG